MRLAIEHWSGTVFHTDQTQEIEECDAVINIFPRVLEMETICNSVSMRVPLDHIESRKSELRSDTIEIAFGKTFLHEVYNKQPSSSAPSSEFSQNILEESRSVSISSQEGNAAVIAADLGIDVNGHTPVKSDVVRYFPSFICIPVILLMPFLIFHQFAVYYMLYFIR